MFNIQLVSQQSFGHLRAKPSNPPVLTDESTIEHFTDEYALAHDAVMAVLSKLGKHDWCGEADFTMNDDVPLAREIGVSLTSKTLWSPGFLAAIQQALASASPGYRAYVDHDLLDDPDFYFLVFSDRVVAWSDAPELLTMFGIVRESDNP